MSGPPLLLSDCPTHPDELCPDDSQPELLVLLLNGSENKIMQLSLLS